MPLNIIEIMEKCDLFIGAGGTMTREMALAGIPTISVYRGKTLDVDKFLIKEGLLKYEEFIDKNIVDIYFAKPMTLAKKRSPITKRERGLKD